MPVRDWDKLRRYDRVRKGGYDPIGSFKAPKRRRKKRHHRMTKRLRQSYRALSSKAKIRRLAVKMVGGVRCALWRKDEDGWRCVKADTTLEWMHCKSPEYVKETLLKLGLTWTWI